MSAPSGSTVTFRRVPADARPCALLIYARKLQREVAKGRPFDCLIAGDSELRSLNARFRGKDYPTDVLSFPSAGTGEFAATPKNHSLTVVAPNGAASVSERSGRRPIGPAASLGDIAISIARARAQARAFGHSTEIEIRVLMLHGVLHLLGLDHETGGGMARAEKRWRTRLGLPCGLIERVTP